MSGNILPYATALDLACENLGSQVLECSNDFFAAKENILKPDQAIFIPDKYTEHGKWMDGWESKRKRDNGYDWCIIKLGTKGLIHLFDIDTTHFKGNHPPYASIDGCLLSDGQSIKDAKWSEIVPLSPLRADSSNFLPTMQHKNQEWNYLRLNIFPDGGVARFRAYGEISPKSVAQDELVDTLAIINGAKPLACSDSFFSPMQNLLRPKEPENMGQGWETRRKRESGHDWLIIKTPWPCTIEKIELSTKHFKGNYPDTFSIQFCEEANTSWQHLIYDLNAWKILLGPDKLGPNALHSYRKGNLAEHRRISFVKLNVFPDGGVARLRAFGKVANESK